MDQVREYLPQSNSLAFVGQSGLVTIYNLQRGNSLAVATNMAAQIDAPLATGTGGPTTINEGLVITSIDHTSFDVAVLTTPHTILEITGAGFDPATIGKLRFEDTAGGQDSNGYYAVCTYISPTLISASLDGLYSSDTSLGPGQVLIYYEDSNNVKSNSLIGINASGTLIYMT